MDKEKIIQAGKISAEVKKYARSIIKKGVPLVEIANKIENKIIELGAEVAFPTNLSINEIAAHYTPSHDDKTLASGLLKVDIGVHIEGWVADSAFSLDLENSEENKKIIKAAELALEAASKTIKNGVQVNEIGKEISKAIKSQNLNPIVNLSGHSIEQYDLHSGITIPNIDDGQTTEITPGIYAIEPFATSGGGKVYDGAPSGIYVLIDNKNVRSSIARETFQFIKLKYNTLPFSSRAIVNELGTKSLFGLKELVKNGNLHSFDQLIESSRSPVAQAENTFLVEEDNVIITSKE